jgi:hypothetical protein
MTWQDHVDWNRELVFSFLFLNFSEVTVVLFLYISEVVEFQIPLLDVAVTWKNTGSVEAENRVGRE